MCWGRRAFFWITWTSGLQEDNPLPLNNEPKIWGALNSYLYNTFRKINSEVFSFRQNVKGQYDSIAAHAGPGIWGVVASVLFDADKGILYKWDKRSLIVS